jgi:excisionase family DNA binding protein
MNWYTPDEVAAQLSCSESTVRRMLKRGELKHRKFGRLVRIPETELQPPTDLVELRRLPPT